MAKKDSADRAITTQLTGARLRAQDDTRRAKAKASVHAVKDGYTVCGLRGPAVEAVTYKANLVTCADCLARERDQD